MRIDCFIMNPPYGNNDDTQLGCRILSKIKTKRAVIICPPTLLFKTLYFQMTTVEPVCFPNIKRNTNIATINDTMPYMFEKKYKYKTSSQPTQFYIQKDQSLLGRTSRYALKIRKIGVEKECNRKTYLNITDKEYNEINKLIDSENFDFDFWWRIFYHEKNGPKFLVPNLLAKTKYAYLVEEVKNNED